MMLALEDVRAGYGRVEVLHGVDLALEPGHILGLLGRNGAGKTTTVRAVMGLVDGLRGSIRIDGTELVGVAPHRVPGHGIAYVPQGRRLFPEMTVGENLRLGALAGRGESAERLAYLLDLFPALKDRMQTPARRLSGGQQQMVAMARALASGPRVLLLDEPTEGLQPSLVDRILEAISELRARPGPRCCWWSRRSTRRSRWRTGSHSSRTAGSGRMQRPRASRGIRSRWSATLGVRRTG